MIWNRTVPNRVNCPFSDLIYAIRWPLFCSTLNLFVPFFRSYNNIKIQKSTRKFWQAHREGNLVKTSTKFQWNPTPSNSTAGINTRNQLKWSWQVLGPNHSIRKFGRASCTLHANFMISMHFSFFSKVWSVPRESWIMKLFQKLVFVGLKHLRGWASVEAAVEAKLKPISFCPS